MPCVGFFQIQQTRYYKKFTYKNQIWNQNQEYYQLIQNECEDFVSRDVEVTSEKILKNLDVTETSRVD